jgi:hypothetical protein
MRQELIKPNRRSFSLGFLLAVSNPRRLHASVVDVRQFGAKFDGATEDHNAINEALKTAKARRIARVQMPIGIAVIGQPIRVPSGVELVGEGTGTILKAQVALDTHVLTNENLRQGDEGISLCQFCIDGNETRQGLHAVSRGIYMFKVTDLLIDSITVSDTVEHCIHISNAGSASPIKRQVVRNCTLIGSGRGGGRSSSGLATTEAHDLSITKVFSKNHERAGFRLGATGSVRIAACRAENCGDGGFVPVSGSDGIEFDTCEAYNNGQSNVYEGFRLVGIRNVILLNCSAKENCGSGVMLLNGCANINVIGGNYSNNAQSHSAPHTSGDEAGICIKATGRSNSSIGITGVVATDTQITKTQRIGVAIIDRGAANVSISGSDLSGNRDAPFMNRSVVGQFVTSNNKLD